MQDYTLDDWRRLGRLIRTARKQAGLRDSNEWASVVGRTTRVLLGLERGERVGDETLGLIERALGWADGDAERVLAGGQPSVTVEDASARPSLSVVGARVDTSPSDEEDNEVLAAIRRDPDLDDSARAHFLNQYVLLRDLSRLKKGDGELLPYVAHGKRTTPVDPAEEAAIEERTRAAVRENPDSPHRDK